jgi:hypothetical protein
MIKVFSFWILLWFILYYFGFTKYNPLFILLVACIFPFIQLIYFIIYKITYYNFFKYLIINIIIKVIPILLIIKFPLRFKMVDVYLSVYLILIYIVLMSIINVNIYEFYKEMISTYIYDDNKNKTSISKSYDYIYTNINK